MSSIVFAVPSLPPSSSPDSLWTGLEMYWIAYDGLAWSLTNPTLGAVMLPGVRGLSMPPITQFTDTYASIPGSRWRGYNTEAREVFWPIQMYSNVGSQDWIDRDSAFWKGLHPRRVGTWVVRQPNGTERRLKLRFKDDGQQEFAMDPAIVGWTNYGITLTAEQPFWEGDPITIEFSNPTGGGEFFGTSGLVISPGVSTANAFVVNDGDEPAWPTWIIDGPATAWSISLGGKSLSSTLAVPAGQQLVVDTHPQVHTALMGGVDRMADLSTRDFAYVPDGESSPLVMSLDGTGKITCKITPQYHRAW